MQSTLKSRLTRQKGFKSKKVPQNKHKKDNKLKNKAKNALENQKSIIQKTPNRALNQKSERFHSKKSTAYTIGNA